MVYSGNGRFDATATTKFANDPAKFLEDNYCMTAGQGFLTVTRVGKGGAVWAKKTFGTDKYPLNDHRLAIGNPDLVTATAIGGRTQPLVYFGLFKIKDHDYEAHVENAQSPDHPQQAYFLPAAANQIVGIKLPATGPKIALTDKLSGCTVFTTTNGLETWMFHANANSLESGPNDPGRVYMRNLFRQWKAGTGHVLVDYFDRPYYETATETWMGVEKQKKIDMGRDADKVHAGLKAFSVFGLRDQTGHWDFKWQRAIDLESVRTGLKKVFMGSESKKFHVALEDLPAAPNPLPNP